MVAIIKQKQLRLPISIVQTITYMQGSHMVTIGKIPRKLQSFSSLSKDRFPSRSTATSGLWCCRFVSVMEVLSTGSQSRCETVLIAPTMVDFSGEAVVMSRLQCSRLPWTRYTVCSPRKTSIYFSSSMTLRLLNELKRWKLLANCTIILPASTESAIPF